MTMGIDYKALAAPFPEQDVEWFVGVTNQAKTSGLAIPFITARAVQNRLDEVVGPGRWRNSFIEWKDGAQLCEIQIYDEDMKQWVGKIDGSGDTDIEGVKGGLSASFKRAATMWGIGRYLYSLDTVCWVDIEPRGKSYIISPTQTIRLPNWALPGGTGVPYPGESTAPWVERAGYAPQRPQQPAGNNTANVQQQTGNNTGNPQRQPSGNLSEKQIMRAYAKGLNAGQQKEDIHFWIKKKYGIDNIADLTRVQYDELCAALDKAAMQQ